MPFFLLQVGLHGFRAVEIEIEADGRSRAGIKTADMAVAHVGSPLMIWSTELCSSVTMALNLRPLRIDLVRFAGDRRADLQHAFIVCADRAESVAAGESSITVQIARIIGDEQRGHAQA